MANGDTLLGNETIHRQTKAQSVKSRTGQLVELAD